MNLIPLEDRVVIIQDEAKKETSAGIIIPDHIQEKPAMGTIWKIGPGKPDKGTPIGYLLNDVFLDKLNGTEVKHDDRIVPVYRTELKEGDRVLFSKYAGVEVIIEDKPYLIVRIAELISRV